MNILRAITYGQLLLATCGPPHGVVATLFVDALHHWPVAIESYSSKSHACRFKSFQFWARSKDCVILICFVKRMEGNGHLGPEKSGFKVPKSPAKTPIGHANSLCSVRSKFHAQCALRISKSNSPCMRSPCMSNCPLAIGVLAGFFGTLEPDFSGPEWLFPSILFCKTY